MPQDRRPDETTKATLARLLDALAAQ